MVQVLFFGGKLQQRKYFARMVKLADTLASGASGREVVQVQVLFRAQKDPCKCKGLLLSHPYGTPHGTLPASIYRFDPLNRKWKQDLRQRKPGQVN